MKSTKKIKSKRYLVDPNRKPGVYFDESIKKPKINGKSDGCYYITYKIGKKLKWEKIGFKSEGFTAQQAFNIRIERQRKIRLGEDLPVKMKNEITMEELWEKYDAWLETGKRHPYADRSYYNKNIKPRFANKRLSEITPIELEKMKAALIKSGLAPATVKHNLVIIRQLYNKAIKWGLWNGQNPIKKVDLPKLNNKRTEFLSPEQALLLLKKLKEASPQLHDMALLSLHTGLRAGEIFSLKWNHINFDHDFITIYDPKGGETRQAYLNKITKTMLQKIEFKNSHDYVFESRNGKKITEISNSFAKIVNKLGFNDNITDRRKRITFHSLRHTFASWLAIDGTPLYTIQKLMGHKTLTMTERYAHLNPEQMKDSVNNLANKMK